MIRLYNVPNRTNGRDRRAEGRPDVSRYYLSTAHAASRFGNYFLRPGIETMLFDGSDGGTREVTADLSISVNRTGLKGPSIPGSDSISIPSPNPCNKDRRTGFP